MYIDIHNRKIHYKKKGNGKPVLFVHGWGGSVYSLHDLAELASKQFSVYLLDLPGFGKSDNPPTHWGVEGYASVIAEFIHKLKLKKPHYVGHSFGGEIGIYLGSHTPHIIDKLVLCNSAFKRTQRISRSAKLMKRIPIHAFPFKRMLYPLIKKWYYRLFHRDSDLMKYPHLEQNFRKIVTQDLTKDTAKIKNETLILWGEEDTYTPVIWAYELEKYIPHAKLHVFPEVRHNLPLAYPKDVWSKIQPFLLT